MISFLRGAIGDVCIESGADKLTLFHLINRVMFMFREPLVFSLYKRMPLKWGNGKEVYFPADTSIRDTALSNIFDDAIKNIVFKKINIDKGVYPFDRYTLDVEKSEGYLIKIFSTDYYLLVMSIERSRKGAAEEPVDIKYNLVGRDTQIGKFFSILLSPFGAPLTAININQHLSKILREYDAGESVRIVNERRLEKYDPDDELKELEVVAKERFLELVSREYAELKGSPIFWRDKPSGGKYLPNIIFNAAFYTREDGARWRGHYAYENQVLICDEQREDILAALETLAEIENDNSVFWRDDPSAQYERPRYANSKADQFFWKRLESQEGRKEIVDALMRPLSQKTRLNCDYSMMSGIAQIHSEPFVNGGLGWIEDVNGNLGEQERFACLHYLSLLMVPPSQTCSAYVLPLRAGGTAYLTATMIRNFGRREGWCFVNNTQWQYDYFATHGLLEGVERRLRRRMKRVYSELLIEKMAFLLKDLAAGIFEDSGVSVRQFLDKMNCYSDVLCRIFPFKKLYFFNSIDDKGDFIVLNEQFPIKIKVINNEFFDNTTSVTFIDVDFIVKSIWDRCNSEINKEIISNLRKEAV